MNKCQYSLDVYDDGGLFQHIDYDDFNIALRSYARSFEYGFHAELYRHKLDLRSNVVTSEKFKGVWE